MGNHGAGAVQPGRLERCRGHQDPWPEGHEADGPVGFIAKRVGDRQLGIADPDLRSRNKLQRPCHLRVDDDAAVRKRRGKLPAAAKLGSADKRPGRIDGFQRHQLALVAGLQHRPHFKTRGQASIVLGKRRHVRRRRNIEAAKLDVAAEKKLRVAGNAASHRLGHRSDGADGGDAEHQSAEKDTESGNGTADFTPRHAPGKPPAGVA